MQDIYGLIGYPVGHSLSPAMMNAAFDATGLDARYAAFAVAKEDIDAALLGMRVLGIRGANVTIPHKEAVFRRLTSLSQEAQIAKAVNTLVPGADALWTGYNTDVEGWWHSFEATMRPKGSSQVAILGAGGAARAVLTGLSIHATGANVVVLARRHTQAQQLLDEFSSHLNVIGGSWDERHEYVNDADFIIQTTPIGMWPNSHESCLADDRCLHKGQVVQDLVYRPLSTKLLVQAESRGAAVVDGARMLVGQGARAFELWTGKPAPVDLMRQVVLEQLQ